MGDFASAQADYDAAFKKDPTSFDSQYGRGLARIRLGQTDLGRADIAAASAHDKSLAAEYAGFGQAP